LNKLPMPYHPVFNAPRFELASRTHFFLCIESKDPKFDAKETRQFLESLSEHEVSDVEFYASSLRSFFAFFASWRAVSFANGYSARKDAKNAEKDRKEEGSGAGGSLVPRVAAHRVPARYARPAKTETLRR